MLELAFLVCLRADLTACEERVLPVFVDVSAMQCLTGAQALLAEWSGRYPEYEIRRWSCRPPTAFSKA